MTPQALIKAFAYLDLDTDSTEIPSIPSLIAPEEIVINLGGYRYVIQADKGTQIPAQ